MQVTLLYLGCNLMHAFLGLSVPSNPMLPGGAAAPKWPLLYLTGLRQVPEIPWGNGTFVLLPCIKALAAPMGPLGSAPTI